MGRRGDPLASTGYLFFLGGRGKEKFWGQILHHLLQAYLNLFFPSLLLLLRNIRKVFNGKTWVTLTATRINFMIGQLVSVAIDHTERNYSPHRPEWPEAMNQLSIFLFASSASGKSSGYFP